MPTSRRRWPGTLTRTVGSRGAYIDVTLHDPMMTEGGQWAALHISILAEPRLRRLVSDWFAERLRRHHDTDGGPELELVRLAADGAWLAHLVREKRATRCPSSASSANASSP